MMMTRSLLLGTASLLIGMSAAEAGTEMFSASYGYALTDWNGVSPENVSLPYFNSHLGTLTSVTVELQESIHSTAVVQNTSAGNIIGSFKDGLLIAVMPIGTSTPVTSAGGNLVKADALFFNKSQTFAPGYSHTVPESTFSNTTSNTYLSSTSASTVSSFVAGASSSFTLPLYTAVRTSTALTGGNLSVSQTTSAYADVTITYSYSQNVPEPGSMAMLGTGLVGLGGALRYRQRAGIAGALRRLWRRKADSTDG